MGSAPLRRAHQVILLGLPRWKHGIQIVSTALVDLVRRNK